MNPNAYVEMADTEARHWWFCGRRKILSSVINSIGLPLGATILELGSGTGGNLGMLSSFGKVSGMEMDAAAHSLAVEKTGSRFDIRLGSCPNGIPFPGEHFDLICLLDVLEHIDEDIETLIAARALLAKGGRVLITVPAYRWLWSAHDEFLHHKRRYTAAELREKATGAGFEIVTLSYFNTLLFPLAVLVRLKDKLLRNSSASGGTVPPSPINRVLARIFALERFIVGRYNLPFGVSLLCVLRSRP